MSPKPMGYPIHDGILQWSDIPTTGTFIGIFIGIFMGEGSLWVTFIGIFMGEVPINIPINVMGYIINISK